MCCDVLTRLAGDVLSTERIDEMQIDVINLVGALADVEKTRNELVARGGTYIAFPISLFYKPFALDLIYFSFVFCQCDR
jgi:hypothetical protein